MPGAGAWLTGGSGGFHCPHDALNMWGTLWKDPEFAQGEEKAFARGSPGFTSSFFTV